MDRPLFGPQDSYKTIYEKTAMLAEGDIHYLRRVVVPLQGAAEAFQNPSRFPFEPHRDLLGVRERSIPLSDEERKQLREAPSFVSLQRRLRFLCLLAMPITYKHRTPRYAEMDRGNPLFRRKVETYAALVQHIPSDRLIFADETSIYKDAFLTKGWGPIWAAVAEDGWHALRVPRPPEGGPREVRPTLRESDQVEGSPWVPRPPAG